MLETAGVISQLSDSSAEIPSFSARAFLTPSVTWRRILGSRLASVTAYCSVTLNFPICEMGLMLTTIISLILQK